MVNECAFTYPDGHHCRRIPRRGLKFCPGHGPRLRRQGSEQAYLNEIRAYSDHLDTLSLRDVLQELSANLAAIHPLIERKSSRTARASFDRALVTVVASIDLLLELRRRTATLLPQSQPRIPAPGLSFTKHNATTTPTADSNR